MNTSERFYAKVMLDPSGCWRWTGFIQPKTGYGRMTVDKQNGLAHRRSWEIHYGPIPDGLCVLHRCDVRDCVRPEHLFLGTYQDNHNDMISKGRNSRGEGRPDAKLTEADVRHICQDRRILKAIASDYGVHLSVIWNVKNRVTWKHVDPLECAP